jgi:hypothetical protein
MKTVNCLHLPPFNPREKSDYKFEGALRVTGHGLDGRSVRGVGCNSQQCKGYNIIIAAIIIIIIIIIIINLYRVIHKSVKYFKNSQQIDYATDHGNYYADRERNSPNCFYIFHRRSMCPPLVIRQTSML